MKAVLLATVLALMALPASAKGPVSFGIHANGAFLNVPPPLDPAYGFGYGGGLHLDINFIPGTNLRISGDYISFGLNEDDYKKVAAEYNPGFGSTGFSLSGGRISILSASANGRFGLPFPVVSPYITAGVGIAVIGSSDLSVSYLGQVVSPSPEQSDETKPSLNIGGGVDLNIAVATIFVEAKYTVIFTSRESSSYIPITIGVTF